MDEIRKERGKFRHQLEGASRRLLELIILHSFEVLARMPPTERQDSPLMTIIKEYLQPHAQTFYEINLLNMIANA